MMSDLLTMVGEMASAIRNPTHWMETFYARVMEVEEFEEQVMVEVWLSSDDGK